MSDKKKTIAVIAGCLVIAGIGWLISRDENALTKTIYAMDTTATITAYRQKDVSACEDEIKKLSTELSAYDESSAFYTFNNKGIADISATQLDIINQAKILTEKYGSVDCTSGRLIDLWGVESDNPHVPSDDDIASALETIGIENITINGNHISTNKNTMLNFGACAKGYALDKLYSILDDNDAECAVISFGSSSLMYGKKPNGEKFTIAVKNPDDTDNYALTIETDACFISTSGGYERYFEQDGETYSHIFSLETGRPAQTDLTSVTVICKNGMESDFLSTVIYIEGTKGLKKHLASNDYSVIAIDSSDNIYCSDGLESSIKIENPKFSIKEVKQ